MQEPGLSPENGSKVKMGDKVNMKKNPPADYYYLVRPLINSLECGDAGIIKEFDGKIFFGLIDVLGHGKDAYKLAVITREFLEKNYQHEPVEIIKRLHEHIKGTRGLVAGIGILDLKSNLLKYAGMGNISLKICNQNKTKNIIYKDGIIGYIISTPRQEEIKLFPNEAIIVYTDGVKERFTLKNCPELLHEDAKTMAARIIQKFGRESDDAACIVIKVKQVKSKN